MYSLILIVISVFVVNVASESCYYLRCIGCRPETAYELGTPVECHPGNWVTPDWFHDVGIPPPNTAGRVPIEYRCLKIVASPEDGSLSRTVDVIKGCIPRVKEDGTCQSISAVQRSRGLPNVRCLSCRGDNCNRATLAAIPIYFITLLLIFHYFK